MLIYKKNVFFKLKQKSQVKHSCYWVVAGQMGIVPKAKVLLEISHLTSGCLVWVQAILLLLLLLHLKDERWLLKDMGLALMGSKLLASALPSCYVCGRLRSEPSEERSLFLHHAPSLPVTFGHSNLERERDTQREKAREKENPPTLYSLNDHHSQGWARSKSGAHSSILISNGLLAGKWTELEQLEFQLVYIGEADIKNSILICCASIPVPKTHSNTYFILLLSKL